MTRRGRREGRRRRRRGLWNCCRLEAPNVRINFVEFAHLKRNFEAHREFGGRHSRRRGRRRRPQRRLVYRTITFTLSTDLLSPI